MTKDARGRDTVAGPAHEPDRSWAERLDAVLADREALLAELDRVSATQADVIASRDTVKLLDLLGHRQRIVDRFVAGQPELLALTGEFEARVALLSPPLAEQLRSRMRGLGEGLGRITRRDEDAQQLLREAKEEARLELMRTNTGAGARAAYRDPARPSNVFADRTA
jgi:hypothetical protein